MAVNKSRDKDCYGKIRYESKGAADNAASHLVRRSAGPRGKAYSCGVCGGRHVGRTKEQFKSGWFR